METIKYEHDIKYKPMKIIFHICFLLFMLSSFHGFAQDRKALEAKRKKTLKDIEYTNSLIKKTRLEKKISMNQLLILNKKIQAREELINNISTEINYLDGRISNHLEQLDKLESDLKRLRNSYAKMIVFAYKTRSSYDKLIFVLSAENFNKAYRRLRYLQYYGEYRQKQMQLITATRTEIQQILTQLKEKKQQKEQLLGESEQEKVNLSQDKDEQSHVFTNLKKKEKELGAKLEEQKKADKKLQETIRVLIADEMRKAREEAEKKARAAAEKKAREEASNKKTSKTSNNVAVNENKTTAVKTTKPEDMLLTPEEQLVNNKFEANKGRLPWPTERGIILSSYGEHDHPILKGIKVRNDGIYISTLPGAIVRSVFDGEVSKVLAIPGKNKIVILRHGSFFTVYANLSSVSVTPGQKVKTKQTIGTASTDPDDEKTFVELQIWNGNIKLNPELWISKSN
jgi:septal ring factor EnvC (AmiA/AmiB activator)